MVGGDGERKGSSSGNTQPDLHSLRGLRTGVLVTSTSLHSTIQKHPGPGAEAVAVSTERSKTKSTPSVCVGVNPVNCVKT